MTNSRTIRLGGLLALGLGCTGPVEEEVAGPQLLSPRQQLKRVSVDLRGVHPSEAEMQAIENNPALYEDYVDRYLQDPRMLERMREIFNYRYLTRTGATYDMGADNFSSAEVSQAIDNEALRLLTRIIEFDLPYSEIVLADYTMANPALAEAFDLDYPEGATNWQPAWYTDDRPHAGILTMSSTWLRYPSMAGNANRHRANALSKMLLCDDYLARPVVLSRAAVDQLTVDPEAAVNENDACQSDSVAAGEATAAASDAAHAQCVELTAATTATMVTAAGALSACLPTAYQSWCDGGRGKTGLKRLLAVSC